VRRLGDIAVRRQGRQRRQQSDLCRGGRGSGDDSSSRSDNTINRDMGRIIDERRQGIEHRASSETCRRGRRVAGIAGGRCRKRVGKTRGFGGRRERSRDGRCRASESDGTLGGGGGGGGSGRRDGLRLRQRERRRRRLGVYGRVGDREKLTLLFQASEVRALEATANIPWKWLATMDLGLGTQEALGFVGTTSCAALAVRALRRLSTGSIYKDNERHKQNTNTRNREQEEQRE
jgi:hypothetical protein